MKKIILTLGLIAGLNSLYAEDKGESDKIKSLNSKAEKTKNNGINILNSNLSGSSSVNAPSRRLAPKNYESLIRRKYLDATSHPDAIKNNHVVKVRVVIARSGNVLSAQIINKSGVASWDQAVQKSLDRVKHIAPFPKSISGSKKTFTLNINSRPKPPKIKINLNPNFRRKLKD